MSEKMKILILSGDGIGPEIMAEAVRVIEAFRGLSSNIELYHGLLGGASIDQHGIPLTSEVSNRASDCNAVLLGPVGDPKWDGSRLGSESPQAGALQLRNQMNVFANLRPFTIPSWGLAKAISSYKSEIIQGVDFMIIRESHGESRFRRMEDNDFALDEVDYRRDDIEKIVRVAAQLAQQHEPTWPVIHCDKANVLATSRLWRSVMIDVMSREYPKVEYRFQLVDSASMQMTIHPRQLNGILVCDSMVGDILASQAAAIPGALELLPSAFVDGINIHGKRINGVYEPAHGSAPEIAGQGVANPIGQILGVALMFRYSFSLLKEAKIIEDSVREVLDSGICTQDLGGSCSTVEMGNAICSKIQQKLDIQYMI